MNTEHEQEDVTCPYDPVHIFPRFRMNRHLLKCRKQHPEMAAKKRQCSYNSTHIVCAAEIMFHHAKCEDRFLAESMAYTVGNKDKAGHIDISTMTKLNISTDENWDIDPPSQSVLALVEKNSEEKNILRTKMCVPKGEKKAFRANELRRIHGLQNDDEPITDTNLMMRQPARKPKSIYSVCGSSLCTNQSDYFETASDISDCSFVTAASSLSQAPSKRK